MDFAKFDARTAASRPTRMHVKHPVTGQLMYNDEAQEQPCFVLLRGIESPEFQKGMASLQRARALSESPQTAEEMQAAAVESAKLLIAGFENMYRSDESGQLRPMHIGDAEWFLNLQMVTGDRREKSFVEQVNEFARKRGNFLGNG